MAQGREQQAAHGQGSGRGLRMALDLGPVLAFFVAYLLLRERQFLIAGTEYSGFVLVTAAFVPLLALTTLIGWRLTGKLSGMNLLTLVLVAVFGALTVWFNDERFFKMKPTILYLLFAAVLGAGLLRGRSLLQPLLGETLPLSAEGWLALTRRLCLFFALLAVANEVIWRSFSTSTWVWFKTFGLTLALFAFFIAQARLIERHGLPAEGEAPDNETGEGGTREG